MFDYTYYNIQVVRPILKYKIPNEYTTTVVIATIHNVCIVYPYGSSS